MSTSGIHGGRSARSLLFTILIALIVTQLGFGGGHASADTIDGNYDGIGMRGGGSTLQLPVAGRGGVPANAEAVALNLTITSPTSAGYATVYPCGSARPNASTINFTTGTTIANGVMAKVGASGRVCIYTHRATHVVVDVAGYHPASSAYTPLNPARLLDTRAGKTTVDGNYDGIGRRNSGATLQLPVAGRGGVPANAKAVALNLTITGATASGYATVYPCGSARPNASTINFTAGNATANGILAKIGTSGRICIYTHRATHVVVDVAGHHPASSAYTPLNPARLLDTRAGKTTVDGNYDGIGRRNSGATLQLPVAGRGGVPANAKAVALNLTITGATASGYATVYPCGSARPNASTINFTAGKTVANGILAKIGTSGRICIYTHRATHVVVDVAGHHPASSAYTPLNPARLLDTRTDSPSVQAAERSLILLNQYRAANGRSALVLDSNMSNTALNWSRQMSLSGFRHSGGPYAENIAWHSANWMSPTEAASTLHQMWVDSPGHRANMLDPRWTRVGIGMHVDGSGWWGTHVFA